MEKYDLLRSLHPLLNCDIFSVNVQSDDASYIISKKTKGSIWSFSYYNKIVKHGERELSSFMQK